MKPGDRVRIHMHDTQAGFRVDLSDLTTGQNGSMTASVANGFGHILYQPNSSTCSMEPYAFHPEYSTANPRGNTWSAHTYNVAFSDEIGHFENCLQIDANFNCTTPGAQDAASGLDEDDGNSFCVPGTDSSLVKIDGCFSDDLDWDGQSYQKDWPGTNPSPGQDKKLHPTPVMFTSPLTDHGTKNYSTIAFEADLPAIEASTRRTIRRSATRPPVRIVLTRRTVRPSIRSTRRRTPTARARGRKEAPSSPGPRTISAGARPPSLARCCRPSSRSQAQRRFCATKTSTAVTCRIPVR